MRKKKWPRPITKVLYVLLYRLLGFMCLLKIYFGMSDKFGPSFNNFD